MDDGPNFTGWMMVGMGLPMFGFVLWMSLATDHYKLGRLLMFGGFALFGIYLLLSRSGREERKQNRQDRIDAEKDRAKLRAWAAQRYAQMDAEAQAKAEEMRQKELAERQAAKERRKKLKLFRLP